MQSYNKDSHLVNWVSIIIRDASHRFLLVRNKQGDLDFPTNELLENQSVKECLSNKAFEDIGITILRYKEVFNKNTELSNIHLHTCFVQAYKGQPFINNPVKYTELKFLTLEEIKDLPVKSDAVKNLLEYAKHLGNIFMF